MQKSNNLKDKKLKDEGLQKQKSNQFFQHILRIHSHRYFRKILFIIISIHLLTFISPFTSLALEIPAIIYYIFKQTYDIWPFPTYAVTSSENQIQIANLIYKILEIVVQLLYTIDLLPKIFIWKKPLWWKSLNVLVVTLMVILVPFTIREYQLYGYSIERLKFRVCSIGLSFLLLCEIMSIREWKTLKFEELKKNKKQSDQKQNEKPEYKIYTWPEIIQHDKRDDCWIVIQGKVYDLSNYISQHPGGDIILDGAGGECTLCGIHTIQLGLSKKIYKMIF
ncbi:hypothetical protein IMG5_132170 [Ichthyophthirius multifiliis]|uniref:Cytochrome b5 heme-binding domain-containing protein n=1 Tax=Ichthyophthirius multifiliis TaxID=5932 RepID=G0QWH2_ICHMU|nr:hypothetical protein IMG5_132170 [Ichthyophthirius multifiliis]EGR30433.1 hypothetical protein IMG5_132170 [Ichthyophthirius multifiliis]|eukprot:XP_004032020.1 hypothetical protein IMG5_132170 [Ichthyophthirius multifiliis]